MRDAYIFSPQSFPEFFTIDSQPNLKTLGEGVLGLPDVPITIKNINMPAGYRLKVVRHININAPSTIDITFPTNSKFWYQYIEEKHISCARCKVNETLLDDYFCSDCDLLTNSL
jgi:hypothetical protein